MTAITATKELPATGSGLQRLAMRTTAIGRRAIAAVGTPIAATLGFAAALGLLAVIEPSDSAGSTICPWRRCTGVSCPGCGMTRAVSRMLHGDLAGALRYHPLVLLAVAEVVAVIGGLWLWTRQRRRLPMAWLNGLIVANIVLFLGVWVVRAIAGSLPA